MDWIVSGDCPFKLAFVSAFMFAVVIAARTARRASRAHGQSINQLEHEIRWLIAVGAALGIVFYAMLAVWFVRDHAPQWASLSIPAGYRWVAVGLLLPVLAFYAWAFDTIGTNYRGGVGLYADHTLVTTGPYAWTRHPINASFIAIMVLVTFPSDNWLLGGSGLLLVLTIAAARIPIEERELAERFPVEWARYRGNGRPT